MAKPIAVVASDNHLEPRAWAKYPDLAGDSYYSFEQLETYCQQNDLPLILAGDVFNTQTPDSETVRRSLQPSHSGGVPYSVCYIQGQHERADPPWLSLGGQRYTHVHRDVFRCGLSKILFYGLDWQPADKLVEELAKIPPGADVLVAHQVWKERMGSICSPEGSLADVPYVKMIITGDLHKHDVTTVEASDGRGSITVLSPGSGCMQSTSEDPKKYFFVLHDDLSVVSVPYKTRDCRYYIFRNSDTFAADLARAAEEAVLQQGVPVEIARPMAVVEYDEALPEAGPRIEKAFAGKAHLFLSTLRKRKKDEEVETRPQAALGVEQVAEQLYREQDPALYAAVLRLIRAEDPKSERDKLVAELLADTSITNPFKV